MSFFSRNWKIKLWNPRMDTKGIWVESFSNSNIDIIAKFLYFFGSDYYFIESQLISCVESWISVKHSIQDFHCLMRFLKSILDLSVKFQLSFSFLSIMMQRHFRLDEESSSCVPHLNFLLWGICRILLLIINIAWVFSHSAIFSIFWNTWKLI